jgi:hypothetical protein
MQNQQGKRRRFIGVLAATSTTLQASLGLGSQLVLACTQGTQDLSFLLFSSSFLGMALWSIWAYTKPEGGPELIIALPNTLGALLALIICGVIVFDRCHEHPPEGPESKPVASVAVELLCSIHQHHSERPRTARLSASKELHERG